MATPVIEVVGPHTISVGGVVLGRGDNDDLFRIEVEYAYTDVFTNESGTMPAAAIRTGTKAQVYFSLVSISRSDISTAVEATDGGQSTSGYAWSKVGTDAQSSTVAIVLTGAKTITVSRARLISMKQQDFGNKASRVVFHYEALPNPSSLDSAIFTVA
jgi:hypothetical protein